MANFGRMVNSLDNSNILNRGFNILAVQCSITAKPILEISSQDFTLRGRCAGKFHRETFATIHIDLDGITFVVIFTLRIFAAYNFTT